MPLVDSVRAELLRREMKATEAIILGVSGGVDSMTLLQVLSEVHDPKYLFVVHVDHGIREDSREDAFLVTNACAQLWIPCAVIQVNARARAEKEKVSIEDMWRRFRYEAFEQAKQQVGAKWVATAHHRQDRAESTLMNITRGAKLAGLTGLRINSPGIIRPFARVDKSDILAFAREKRLKWREDSTNSDTTYLRNYLRKNVVPQLEKINGEFSSTLCELSDYAGSLKDALDELFLSQIITDNVLSVRPFAAMGKALQSECIRCIYERATGGTIGLSDGLVEELSRYILTARGGTKKEVGKLLLTKKQKNVSIGLKRGVDTSFPC